MINLAVINLKELAKYLRDFIIVALCVTVIFIFIAFYAKSENFINILSDSLSIFKYGKVNINSKEKEVSNVLLCRY